MIRIGQKLPFKINRGREKRSPAELGSRHISTVMASSRRHVMLNRIKLFVENKKISGKEEKRRRLNFDRRVLRNMMEFDKKREGDLTADFEKTTGGLRD